MKEKKLRAILFEDNKHLREIFQLLIASSQQFECVGAFADTRNIIATAGKLLPDIILMDIEMPVMNGIDATRLVKQKFPELPVLILTVFDDSRKIFEALCAGSNGYLLKNAAPDEILNAMMDVYHGGSVLSPPVAKKVVQFFQRTTAPVQDNSYHLTPKEKELLLLLVDGMSYKMIAGCMLISLETVKSHIKNIYKKLHVQSNAEAVAKAIKQRIV